jgi:uncharacterized membrane protein HdeD (DUF308 family)
MLTATKHKAFRRKEWTAVIVALGTALVVIGVTSAALTIWDKPRAWVPILAGGALGILTYALIAPES